MPSYSKLKIVNSDLNYAPVSLIEPSESYYLHLALEIDKTVTPFYLFNSLRKKNMIKKCKQFCDQLLTNEEVLDANVFEALLIPPGKGKYIAENETKIHVAKFDLVLLVEVASKEALLKIEEDQDFLELRTYLKENSNHFYQTQTKNARRIGAVDHSRQGVFLFNYFFAEDVEQNLEVWNYTAGWFEKETNLDNSTLLLPLKNESSDYTVINHCRWDNLRAIIPSLLFKKTFNTYVLDNFYENKVGAMPILYRLVQ